MHPSLQGQAETTLHKKNSVDTAIVLAVVGNLGPSTPNDLAASSDKTELGNVDLDNGTFGKNSKLCVPRMYMSANVRNLSFQRVSNLHGVLGVLLDGNNG